MSTSTRSDSGRRERWNLWLDRDLAALPWPWPGKRLADLAAADVTVLPGATDGFLRYSPTDGTTDRVQVPAELPREAPRCRTALAVYHDAATLTVCIAAARPADPIPELADCANEDFAVVLPSGCPGRGFYFGMDQTGGHIGCAQIWDKDFPCEAQDLPQLGDAAAAGPSGWQSVRLDGLYEARVIATADGLTACFQISLTLAAAGKRTGAIRLSAGRVCYATGEWVSWGSPIIWSPREDLHGAVRLVDAPQPPRAPTLARLDLIYTPETESCVIEGRWQGTDAATLRPFLQGNYADYAGKATVALNGVEQTGPLAPLMTASFALPEGWNRIEIMSAPHPVREVGFEKVSGRTLRPSPVVGTAAMPGRDQLEAAFAVWHEAHERSCLGGGVWGEKVGVKRRHCLCHCGIFHIEPYLVASRCLGRRPAWDQRIRETCERMLAEQRPEGWFPCTCSANTREPQLGDGGAFTNGSVGEGLVLASELLGEPAWLAAAQRAADYAWYRWENNQNYAAFALWHLAALHARDPQRRWLDRALYLARHFVIRDIGLSGAQGGHNYFTGYGNITLKGLARFLAVLPAAHAFYATLEDKTIRFANQILSRQQPGGLFAGRNRKYLGYCHPVPGLFFVADALPQQTQRLAPALAAMTHAVLRGGAEDPARKVDSDSGLVLALALRAV